LTLSWTHFFLGNYPVALEYALESLKESEHLDLKIDEGWALDELACIYGVSGDFTNALHYHRKAVKLFEELNDIDGSIRATNNLAMTLYQRRDYVSALETILESLKLAKRWEREIEILNISCTAAQITIDTGELEKAETYLRTAIDIAENLEKPPTYYTYVLIETANLALKEKDLKKAKTKLLLALDVAEKNGQKAEQAQCHRKLSEIHEEEGNYQEALMHQKTFQTIYEEVAGEQAAMRIAVLSVTHQTEQLRRDMEEQRIQARNEERQRMARDLHDSLSQSIHSMVLFSETLVATLEKKKFERANKILERLQESARQSHKETRLLLYQLQAEGPERSVDLIRGLEERLAKVERHTGIRAQVVQKGSLEYCPREWQENLFWITIEALNNALKHAQARTVKVVIRCSPQRVELEVIDDGIGFDPGKVNAGGMGLENMHARAELLGGKLTIESEPTKGTNVRFVAEIKAE
jgi:signal transduction histidine kinase